MLGITILPEYIQSEGPEALLDNLLKRLPLSAVATSPYVMEECAPERGGEREPPADSGKGLARLLDRRLWGKREVWVSATPSFEPNTEYYQGLRYQPLKPTDLTDREGPVIDRFIEACQARRLKVYLQVQAAIPPGYRVQFGGPEEDDMARLPDGSLPSKRLDKNGSLASPHILAYGEALIRDLLSRYPDISGLRLDWPEYPPYFLETVFLDFCYHAKNFAETRGLDFEGMRRNVGALYKQLTEQLDDKLLRTFLDSPDRALGQWADCRKWLKFKALLVSNLLKRFRKTMDEAGGPDKELFPSAFPPPWNHLSGFDYSGAAEVASAISCKYYTMHWPMMLGNYADSLTAKNSGLSEALLVACLAKAFDAVSPVPSRLTDLHYPDPEEDHPVELESLSVRQSAVQSWAGDTPVWPLGHAYGPPKQFIDRAAAVLSVSPNRLWINRYAYLSEAKLDALSGLFSAG